MILRKIVIMSTLVMTAIAEESSLITHSEFSYINTKGNTDTSSLAFEGVGKKNWDDHFFRLNANAYQSSQDGVTSKEKFLIELNYDYQIDPMYSFNYIAGYKKDRFSGFDYQFYTGPGLGVKLIDTPEHKLTGQGNILYALDQPEVGDSNDYLSGRVAGNYQWQILENLKFVQDLNYRVNLEETQEYFVNSKSAIETKINSNFSMGLAYKIDYVNLPPVGFEKTDRTFLASLIIDY